MNNATNTHPPLWHVTLVAGALLTIAIGLTVQTWLTGRPVTLPDAAHEQIACASYTPSHNGHTLAPAEKRVLVASDLKILAQRFRCVRTYSVSEGLDEVPKVARELGLNVMLGLWISSHAPSNDKEIAHGIALANQYSDVVTAVIVGNEVLLRREQTPTQMRALLERVRAGTSVPVTYADVWEFWLRNAELADAANFVTIHILPYWEDNPIGIDHALDHVKSIYAKVQTAFPGKQIFIGETGWPSEGRPRLTAVPSLLNEARFIREFIAYAEHDNVSYNLIEAFDQPWKRNQEGTVGGYWGLYNAAGDAKFPFTGPVVAEASWRTALFMALICTAIFVLIGAALKPRPSVRALALFGIAGHIAGSMLFAQWQYLSTANRSPLEWLATCAWSLSGWLTYGYICVALARWLDGASLRQPASIANVVRSWGHGAPTAANSPLLGVSRFLVLAGLAYVCLALAYEGRGRDFPLALVTLPTVMLMMLDALTRARMAFVHAHEELLLAVCIGLSAVYIAWHETFANLRATAWSALCLLYALLLCWRAMHPNQRTEHQPDTTQLKGV